jgi:hypothetical protein
MDQSSRRGRMEIVREGIGGVLKGDGGGGGWTEANKVL